MLLTFCCVSSFRFFLGGVPLAFAECSFDIRADTILAYGMADYLESKLLGVVRREILFFYLPSREALAAWKPGYCDRGESVSRLTSVTSISDGIVEYWSWPHHPGVPFV